MKEEDSNACLSTQVNTLGTFRKKYSGKVCLKCSYCDTNYLIP